MAVAWAEHGICKACYSCARNCPVSAIKVDKGQARIDEELCIYCGNCLRTCCKHINVPVNELPYVQEILDHGQKNIVILDYTFQASLGLVDIDKFLKLMKRKGFSEVVSSQSGLAFIREQYESLLDEGNTVITSHCPIVVDIIERQYPELVKQLAPYDSPALALAKYYKHKNPKRKVVYIGPCLGRKKEFDRFGEGYVDAVLSFFDLKELLGEELQHVPSNNISISSSNSLNGMESIGSEISEKYQPLVIQGNDECVNFLSKLENGISIKPRFVDIYFCKGCTDGPLIDSELDLYSRKIIANQTDFLELLDPIEPSDSKMSLDLKRQYVDKHNSLPMPSEDEIRAILKHTFKRTENYDLNCGLCGYDTCRERAIAVFQGIMEIDMCPPYLLAYSRGEIELFKNQFDHEFNTNMSNTGLIGSSKAMKYLRNMVSKVSQNEATVLLLGESGVGKEVVAKAIHIMSGRKKEPFIGINCAALPDLLLESELFGYEDGAFTGARKGGKEGRFELAAGGTILLDEIGDLPLAMQAKLLRVLQEKEFSRLGGTAILPLNARIIAATNKDLQRMVDEGKFRSDLFYRLNVISIEVPSLRDRKDDIPALMGHFLRKVAADRSVSPKIFSDEALELMLLYDWPGNIRELENVIERLIYTCEGNVIKASDLPQHIQDLNRYDIGPEDVGSLKSAVQELERTMIINALKISRNNKVKAAGVLGLARASFYQKLKEYALM